MILEITVDDYQLLKEIALTPFDKFFESLNIINKLNDGNIEDEIIKEMERVASHLKLLIQENEIKERLISKCNNYLKLFSVFLIISAILFNLEQIILAGISFIIAIIFAVLLVIKHY